MPWKRMRLRGDEVFARVDASGVPVAEGGRVEVRYRAGVSKPYRAAVANLTDGIDTTLLADAHCADEDAATSESTARAGATAKRKPARAGAKKAVADPSPGAATDLPARGGAEVIVYADGACTGNPGPAGLGMVLIDGPKRLERSEYLGQGTNNIAELRAIQRAIEAVPDMARPVTIHTDSQYSIGVLSKGWKAKANRELIAEILALLAGRPHVRFVYVPGHAGVVLNERADALARAAVQRRGTEEKTYP